MTVAPTLLGEYTPFPVQPGEEVLCRLRGLCRVTSWSDAPIPWPRVRTIGKQGGNGLRVDGQLLRAIRTESAAALMHWFGVSAGVVWKWRTFAGVSGIATTPGSKKAHLAASQLGAEAIKVKEWTDAELATKSEAAKKCGTKPRRWKPGNGGWTAWQAALLGTAPDGKVAKMLGRSWKLERRATEARETRDTQVHTAATRTMTDRSTLLATVLENPSDDTARLVLADLLRESENTEDQARGRFVWGGITAASYSPDEPIEDRLFYTALAELSAVASSGLPAQWLSSLGIGPSPLTKGDWGWDNTHDRVTVRVGHVVGVFARGMLAELSLPLGEWYEIASDAVALWPLERVSITDAPELMFAVAKDGEGWRLTARLRVPAGMAPAASRVEGRADWSTEARFENRRILIEGIAAISSILVADLREVASDRWPRPPRKR